MRGAAAILVVIDVERIDPDERRARLCEILGCVLRDERMLPAGVGVGAPMRVPAGVHEHRSPIHVLPLESRRIDRAFRANTRAYDDARQIGDCFQRIARDVAAVFVAMERGVDVGTGVGQELDLADLKSGAGRVASGRGFTREPIAHRG